MNAFKPIIHLQFHSKSLAGVTLTVEASPSLGKEGQGLESRQQRPPVMHSLAGYDNPAAASL